MVAPQRLAFAMELYEPDDDLVFKLRPENQVIDSQFEFSVSIVTNSLGFRDDEISEKPDSTYRILGVGDSFSFANGVEVENTYFKQLEQCLNSETEHTIEIINGAVPAYSLIQEINFIKRYSEELETDAVLLGFYVGNDFIDSYELYDENHHPLIEVRDHQLYSGKESDKEENIIRHLTRPVRYYLAERSHFYTFSRNRMSELLVRSGLRAPIPPPEFLKHDYSTQMEEAWQYTRQLFLELAEYTDAAGIDLYVVILPTIYQGHREAWEQYVEINKIDHTLYDLEKAQRILSEFLDQQQINVIDVLPKIKSEGKDELLFYPVDSHMNDAGHRVVADSLCGYLSPQFDRLFVSERNQ